MLLASGPRYDMDVHAEEELYFVDASALEDELNTVVVFAVEIFLVVVVALLIGATAGQDIGQVDAEYEFTCVLLTYEQHGIARLGDVFLVEDGVLVVLHGSVL